MHIFTLAKENDVISSNLVDKSLEQEKQMLIITDFGAFPGLGCGST